MDKDEQLKAKAKAISSLKSVGEKNNNDLISSNARITKLSQEKLLL
ncbi:hypothetical protein AGMMS49921_07380 [Endomicrobiia bacterium]|nr:hypothetical protein AGMMS49921_07270 [Endomicrobiia bacterium]GHT42372.1 hypothetical protein AGMMS49921_07380 [Endomicrobiia bacterium]